MDEKIIKEALGIPGILAGKFCRGPKRSPDRKTTIVCDLDGVPNAILQIKRTETTCGSYSELSVMVNIDGDEPELTAKFTVITQKNPASENTYLPVFYFEMRRVDATSPAAAAIAEINKQFTKMAADFKKEHPEACGSYC